jgi:hypothetical protein
MGDDKKGDEKELVSESRERVREKKLCERDDGSQIRSLFVQRNHQSNQSTTVI